MQNNIVRLLIAVLLCAVLGGGYFFLSGQKNIDSTESTQNVVNSEDISTDKEDSETNNTDISVNTNEIENFVDGTDTTVLSDEEFLQLDVPADFSFGGANLELFYNAFINNKDFFDQDEKLYLDVFRAYLFAETSSNQEVNELVKCWDGEEYTLNGELQQLCEGGDVYIQDADANFFHERDTFRSFKKIMQGEDFSCDYFLTKEYDYPKDDAVKNKVFDYFSCKAIENDSFDVKREYFLLGVAMDQNRCDVFDNQIFSSVCKDFSVVLEENTLSTENDS